MPAPAEPAEPRRRGCGLAAVGIVLILALLAAFIFYQMQMLPFRVFGAGSAKLEMWAGKVRDAFVAVTGMQPRVTVNEQVFYEQTSPVLELAVIERDMVVERETEDTWLGSTKRIRVRGKFRVKAGFDLTRPWSARIVGDNAEVVEVQMPPAKLLSVEQQKVEVLTMDDGLWNHMKPADYAEQVNALNVDARLKAGRDGLTAEARKVFAGQIEQKLGPGHRVELTTSTPARATENGSFIPK